MGVPKGFGSNIGMVHSPHWTGACNWQNHWPMVVLSTAQKTQKQMAAAKKGDSSLLKESHGLHVSWMLVQNTRLGEAHWGSCHTNKKQNIRSSLVVQLRAKYKSVVLLSLETIVPHWKTKTVWHQRILVVVSPLPSFVGEIRFYGLKFVWIEDWIRFFLRTFCASLLINSGFSFSHTDESRSRSARKVSRSSMMALAKQYFWTYIIWKYMEIPGGRIEFRIYLWKKVN